MGLLELLLFASTVFGVYSAVQPAPCPVTIIPENNHVDALDNLTVKEYTIDVDCSKLTVK